jgi:tRNA (guanine9-N1)-methyltransferase
MEAEERPVKRQRVGDAMTDLAKVEGGKEAANSTNKNSKETETSEDQASSPTSSPEHNDYCRENTYPITLDVSGPPLSKSQLKRLRRNQAWEAGREYRKAKRKQKVQAKREKRRAARNVETTAEDPVPATNGAATFTTTNGQSTVRTRPAKKEHRGAVQLPVSLILDCGFDVLMLPKEIISLGSQLTRCYSDNAKARYRAHLVVCSFGGRLKERFETVLSRQHEGWKFVKFMEEDFVEGAEQARIHMKSEKGGQIARALSKPEDDEEGEVVYLTSDSPDTLDRLKPNSTYIIGGLVDKNRHKGICYKTALEKGVKTAKLPIGEYMQMNSRFVLATNHVVEIMLAWLDCEDWGEAFERVIPKRKGGVVKGKERGEHRGDTNEDEDEKTNGETGVILDELYEAVDKEEVGLVGVG